MDQLRVHGLVVVILDPAGIARPDEVADALPADTVIHVHDWYALRQAFERLRSLGPSHTGVIHSSDPTALQESDLPWDVSENAAVTHVRAPRRDMLRDVVLALDDVESDRLMRTFALNDTPTRFDVLAVLTGLPPASEPNPSDRLRVVLRLLRHGQPEAVVALARLEFRDEPVLAAALQPERDLGPLLALWQGWADGTAGAGTSTMFQDCRTEMTDLFLDGSLNPVVARATGLPSWAKVGVRLASPTERLQTLLAEQPPTPSPGDQLEPWLPVAAWWGAVRNELAQVNPPDDAMTTAAWDRWEDIDGAFLAWIRESYGSQLQRSWVSGPKGLHQVQRFLSHRIGATGHALLLVFDGMSHTLWSQLSAHESVNVLHSTGTLAMLPTLTEISRQAIAAGDLPNTFPETLFRLDQENARWQDAWERSGRSAVWMRVDGKLPELPSVPLGHYDAIGLVVSATDKQMHSTQLLGDVELHAVLAAWLGTGFLDRLLRQAAAHGYQVWITADHGGLACHPEPGVNEGKLVERQGTRHRRYANRTLRDTALADGIVLDPIPGLPASYAEKILFAPGRVGWKNSHISHGGLSMDEVIVPFAQVAAS